MKRFQRSVSKTNSSRSASTRSGLDDRGIDDEVGQRSSELSAASRTSLSVSGATLKSQRPLTLAMLRVADERRVPVTPFGAGSSLAHTPPPRSSSRQGLRRRAGRVGGVEHHVVAVEIAIRLPGRYAGGGRQCITKRRGESLTVHEMNPRR